MELGTDYNRYGINISMLSNEQLAQYIETQEQRVVEAQTHLQLAWEELAKRN